MGNGTEIVALLRACAKQKDLQKGIKIHMDTIKGTFHERDCYVTSNLVRMYAMCGALSRAANVLAGLPVRDVVCWNVLITAYVQYGHGDEALKCLGRMQVDGLSPNTVTFICFLKACGSIRAIDKGRQIHSEILWQGLLSKDVLLGTTLVNMYAKCGDVAKASRVLDELPVRDVALWNALITGYCHLGQGKKALECFQTMQQEGLSPNTVTFTCILKACGSIGAIAMGERIHREIGKQGLLQKDVMLGNALVDMYAKCHSFTKASQVLKQLPVRTVVSWNSLITGYAQQGQGEETVRCFKQMQQGGISPNSVSLMCMLKACGHIGTLHMGIKIHEEIEKQALLGKDIVLGNALMDTYAKCGDLARAARVLQELSNRDVISWSALIAGYVQQGNDDEALKCFEQMQQEGHSPNVVTFTSILKACASSGAVDKGEQIHGEILRQGLLGKDIALGTTLVDMYAKCGELAKALCVFDELPVHGIVSWSTLITAYVQHGQGEKAVQCFGQMQREGLSPDTVTLVCVLSACSRLRLSNIGEIYFSNMTNDFGIAPLVKHLSCMVDLFNRTCEFQMVLGLMKKMPLSEQLSVWYTVLSACREYGNMNLVRDAFYNALKIP